MKIQKWESGYRATAEDWFDGRHIFLSIECFRPGQSLSQPPAWEKAFLLPKAEEDTIRNYFNSVVNHFAAVNYESKMLGMYENGKRIVSNGKRVV